MIQIELAVLDAPRTVANFVALARREFSRRHAVSPRGRRLRRPGRRSARRRRRRPGLHDSRRDQPAAVSARHRRHGARLGGHRRQPVLHHALAAAAPRRRGTRCSGGWSPAWRWSIGCSSGTDPDGAGVGRRWPGSASSDAGRKTGSRRRRYEKRGRRWPPPLISHRRAGLPLLRLLGLLGRLLCLLRHWSNPPLQVGLMRKVMPRHRGCLCRLALSPPVPAPSRLCARFVSRAIRAICWAQGRRKGGAVLRETAPFQSGQSYFFFAFLAFLAAFFAFFAIVPPEGVGSCLMATADVGHEIRNWSLRGSQAVV